MDNIRSDKISLLSLENLADDIDKVIKQYKAEISYLSVISKRLRLGILDNDFLKEFSVLDEKAVRKTSEILTMYQQILSDDESAGFIPSSCEMTYSDGIYHFSFPPIKPSACNGVNSFHKNAVKGLINRHLRECPEIEIIEHAVVVFLFEYAYHISPQVVPDSDNLSTKGILDALGGKIIREDKLINLMTVSLGRRAEESRFHMFVMDESKAISFLEKLKMQGEN